MRFWKQILVLLLLLTWQTIACASDLRLLRQHQKLSDFSVEHLYSDTEGKIVGAKFLHIPTGAPIYLLQIETVPQVFTWVQSPADSNRGLPHALEHLLILKGTKGRYLNLLEGMRLSGGAAATGRDFVYYGLYSGSGIDSFFEQFHTLLDALYHPDFTDIEAEREFYHFSVARDSNKNKALIEGGTVYDEMLSQEDRYRYVFELSNRVLGEQNPLAFDSGGVVSDMRGVTTQEIRQFHAKYYRLGPGTGFIFSFPPNENVPQLLARISAELMRFSGSKSILRLSKPDVPKYPIHRSRDLTPGIYPFPSPNAASPSFVHFSWIPTKTESSLRLKLLELFLQGLGARENSLLYRVIVDSNTRTFNSEATGVDYSVSLDSSPEFPVAVVEVSGVPGNQISVPGIERLRGMVTEQIKAISEYQNQSESLKEFNQAILSYTKNIRRSRNVWVRNPPGFDRYPPAKDWMEYLLRSEMDPAFIRSLSEDQQWNDIDQMLRSGKNIWKEVIQSFHLLEMPYSTAGVPSPVRLEELGQQKQVRIQNKIAALKKQYHTENEQEALSRFEADEFAKTETIDAIDAKVKHPRFTEHPPLVPDEQLKYKKLTVEGTPVIVNFFDRPPVLDIGVSFDLTKIPRRYYKYLPLLPSCLDSLGIQTKQKTVSYEELSHKILEETYTFSTAYETNPDSRRADLTIRASTTSVSDFRRALKLIQQLVQYNGLYRANAGRLRDIIARRVSTDNLYASRDSSTFNSGYSFRYQNNPLYLALTSRFTDAHYDSRLQWLLHEAVHPEEIDGLNQFAKGFLATSSKLNARELANTLDGQKVSGLEAELIQYWRRNLALFPEAELNAGLCQLTSEVEDDLRAGPEQTISDLLELQQIVLDKRALHIDLTMDRSNFSQVRADLARFIRSIPTRSAGNKLEISSREDEDGPILQKLKERYHLSAENLPLRIGLVNPSRTGGDAMFTADFTGYSQVDHESLLRVLASGVFAGIGPQSFQMKTAAKGLAFQNGISSDPATLRLWYYADRSPDLGSLIEFVNQMSSTGPTFKDPSLVDYTLSYTLSFSRVTSTFSERGQAAAHDIRDGNQPEKIQRFSEQVLKLRQDPDLLQQLTRNSLPAICGVLLRDDCREHHLAEHSIFFFVGSEQVLDNVEKHLSLPPLLRLYPSDFWLD